MKAHELLISDFDMESASTLRILEGLSDDIFDYTPHAKSMTVSQLANHILGLIEWIPAMVKSPVIDFQTYPQLDTCNDVKTLVRVTKEQINLAKSALKTLSDDVLNQEWTLRSGDTVLAALPKHQALRVVIFSHIIHHRAQLSLCLRMKDKFVPAAYFMSADQRL